jgi:hypothetical protein
MRDNDRNNNGACARSESHGRDDCCCVRIVTNFKSDDTGEHPWSLCRLERTNCELVEIASPPKKSDLFIFNLVRPGHIPTEVTAWRAKSAEAAFLLSSIFYEYYKDRLRALVRSWPHYLDASHAIYRRTCWRGGKLSRSNSRSRFTTHRTSTRSISWRKLDALHRGIGECSMYVRARVMTADEVVQSRSQTN